MNNNDLARSEITLQTLFNLTNDAILITQAPEGNIVDANSAATALLGYSRDELVKLTGADILAPSDLARAQREQQRQVAAIGYFQLETLWVKQDGTYLPVAVNGKPINLDGITYFLLMGRDISTSKETEKNLIDALHQLNLAIKTAKLGIWRLDVATGRLSWNDEQLAIYGLSRQQFEEDLDSWRSQLHPEDVDHANAELAKIFAGKSVYDVEFRLIRPDGEIRHVSASGTPLFDENNNVVELIGINLDVTPHKEQEARLRERDRFLEAIFEHSLNAIIVADDKGNYLMVNEAAADLFGIPVGQMTGMNVRDLEVNQVEEAEKLFQAFLHQGQQINEFSFVRPDGEPRITQYFAKRIEKDLNVSILTDITNRKRAEAERLRLDKLESLGILAGGIAHDFNNLLTGLFGNIELAMMLLSDQHKAYEYLELAEYALEQATQLTEQLLTFAKGGQPIKTDLSIADLVTESANFSARGSHVKLAIEVQPDIWPVNADKGQLSQVISNLVINAQQAMPLGGTISIAVANHSTPDGRFVAIRIEDEGMGIAPEDLEKIFDPYFSTKQQGSGLGLASAYSIVSRHDGHIEVESQLNQGTTFTVFLPAGKRPKDTAAKSPRPTVATTAGPRARVLVLDDDPIIRRVIGLMMEQMGHDVVFTVDGKEAIDLYRQALAGGNSFDLVITDLTIPGGLGGLEAAQAILLIDAQAKIIVSSGYSTDPVMANYQAHGFKGVITKPYHFVELRQLVQQTLALP